MPGGHCSILECPEEVNAHLRGLVDSVRPGRLHFMAEQIALDLGGRAFSRSHRAVQETGQMSAVSVPAHKIPSTGARNHGPYGVQEPGGTAAVGPPGANFVSQQ